MSTSEDTTSRPGLSYRDAGVDIDAGNDLVQRIAPLAKATHRPGVLSALGGFGALFELPVERYRQPVLVAGTDGVGTKLALAVRLGQHDTIGVDLVAMCANDIVVTGAEPLFFLDYYATGKLEVEVASRVVAGIAEGCRLAGAALVGGETAEMPGMYQGSDYDLAGFCVGIVERDAIIDGSRVDSGDVLIGLASSGPHSNGYSLIRNILDHMAVDPGAAFEDSTLGEVLMTPTRIYVKSVLGLATQVSLKAVCHITGGGILENLPRVLPAERCARVNLTAWTRPAIFDWLQEQGEIDEKEMLRTFNCGIGMVLCVAERDVDTALSSLRRFGETPYPIGTVVHSTGPASVAFV